VSTLPNPERPGDPGRPPGSPPASPNQFRAYNLLAEPVDGGGTRPSRPEAVRVGPHETLLLLFTSWVQPVRLHYRETEPYKGNIQCAGAGCPICQAGKAADERRLLPVYDVIAQAVRVLPVSPNMRPWALAPQLRPVLRRVEAGEKPVIGVTRNDRYECTVSTYTWVEDGGRAAQAIAAFFEGYQAGTVDLAAVYPRVDADEMARFGDVAQISRYKRPS
jgi:hypothetical protein